MLYSLRELMTVVFTDGIVIYWTYNLSINLQIYEDADAYVFLHLYHGSH